MSRSMELFRKLFLNTLIAVICCIAVGLISYGWSILSLHSSSSVFIFWGIIGALFFFALRDTGLRNALAILLVLALINEFLINYPHSILSFIFGLLFTLALAASLYIYFKWFYVNKKRSLLNPIILAVMLTLFSHLIQLIVSLIHPVFIRLSWNFWYNLLLSLVPIFLTGLALGVGIWITDYPAVVRLLNLSIKDSI